MFDSDRDRALFVSGALGGPFSIWIYTPLRNAITLGSKYLAPTSAELYRMTFKGGVRFGYTGCASPTIFSGPQFIVMGPAFHQFSSLLGPTLAVLPTALCESTISYGSQARNAQKAYNQSCVTASQRMTRLQSPWSPVGAGFAPHVLRNCFAMSGIRVLYEPFREAIDSASGGCISGLSLTFAADFCASIVSAACSMPFNQCFNYLAVTPDGKGIGAYLKGQYLEEVSGRGVRVSPRFLRDVFMRCAYIAPQLSTFAIIERACLAVMVKDA